MQGLGEFVPSPPLPANTENIPAQARGTVIAPIDAKRLVLERARRACETSLQELDADMQNLEAERERLKDAVDPEPAARLRLLASMSEELRTSLQAILGYAQLFRIRGGLDMMQAEWVESLLYAGTALLGQVHSMVSLADMESEPGAWSIDESAPVPQAQAAAMDRPQPDAALSGTKPESSHEKLHVLIADDVPMNREIASAFMRAAGHAVTVAETGRKAVATAASADFDVILMDVRMPDIDGLEATRQIRALAGARGRVPIIALTAQIVAERVEACRAAGMNGHLAKPVRYDTLNAAIQAAVAEGKAARRRTTVTAIRSTGAPEWHRNDGDVSEDRAAFARVTALSHAMRAESCHRDTGVLPYGAGPAWIDIESPWHMKPGHMTPGHVTAGHVTPGGQPARPNRRRAYILDTQFKLKLTSVGSDGHRRFVDSTRTCTPPGSRDQQEFHWLLYTDPAATKLHVYSAVCDLWRWNSTHWRSISVPGANFTPDEMYEQGWRYCGPCFEKSAVVEIE